MMDATNFKGDDFSRHVESKTAAVDGALRLFYHNYRYLISADLQRCKFPFTGRALFFSIKKIEEQLSVMDHAMKTKNHYVVHILLRTVIEHFLIGYYIALRCEETKNDIAGMLYYT